MNAPNAPSEVRLDRLTLHDLTFGEAVDQIASWAVDGSGGYVCTPNVDYIVRCHRDPDFLAAVQGARLRVPDGMGVIYGSRLAGRPLRATVTGRRLPEAVGIAVTQRGGGVALVGGAPAVVARAAVRLQARGVRVVAALSPSMGFELGSADDVDLIRALQAKRPAAVFVGFGAPKQELWLAAHTADLPASVLVGVGGGIDVLGGRARTPPIWMTRLGLEWLFRLAQEPRRLARRYLWDDPPFFAWMLAERLSRSDR